MIRKKALEKGIIDEEQELTQEEIYALIMAPGFSTATEVSKVSGRGVGMDVVKKEIEALRGSVEIQSTPGQGTIISLYMPLTLAIIDGLLVEVGEQRFIIPVSMVAECLEISDDILEPHPAMTRQQPPAPSSPFSTSGEHRQTRRR